LKKAEVREKAMLTRVSWGFETSHPLP